MKPIFTAVALALLCLAAGQASADQTDSNGHLWLNIVGDHPLFDSPWGVHLEVQNRRSDLGDEWQQLLVRPGINYTISPAISASAGWAYVRTYSYGDFPAPHDFPEHRAWEQVVFSKNAFGLEWQHRLRLEQRWIGEMQRQGGGDYSLANWRYENRFRYLLRTSVPLTADQNIYLALWNEMFWNFGSNVSRNYFDQNRFFIGIGRKLTSTTRFEAGFMEQTLQRRGGAIWEHNHTISLWLLSKWPFGRS